MKSAPDVLTTNSCLLFYFYARFHVAWSKKSIWRFILPCCLSIHL